MQTIDTPSSRQLVRAALARADWDDKRRKHDTLARTARAIADDLRDLADLADNGPIHQKASARAVLAGRLDLLRDVYPRVQTAAKEAERAALEELRVARGE